VKIAAVIASFAVFAAVAAAAPVRALWSGLEPGSYSVGYRARNEVDLSRAAFGKALGRTVGIQIWYPARPSGKPKMRFDRYVLDEYGLTGREASPDDSRAAIAAFAATLNPDLRGPERIGRLLSMPTAARRDAPSAPGKFPLVLYFHTGAA